MMMRLTLCFVTLWCLPQIRGATLSTRGHQSPNLLALGSNIPTSGQQSSSLLSMGSLDALVGTGLLTGIVEANAVSKASDALRRLGHEVSVAPMVMRRLGDSPARCNDNSPAGYYLRRSSGSKKWVIFLEGGWYCFDELSCRQRWGHHRTKGLMTSRHWPEYKQGSGILSPYPEVNPHWWRYNHIHIPYCSSDAWTGNHSSTLGSDILDSFNNVQQLSFMGSIIIEEVIRDLVDMKQIEDGHSVILAGSSAGALGVLLNVDRVSQFLELKNKSIDVRGIVDSGWFLDVESNSHVICRNVRSCPPLEAAKRGLSLWQSIVPPDCAEENPPETCFLGHKVYPYIKAPLFIFQWLFDEAQMFANNIMKPSSQAEWNHIHSIGERVRHTLSNVVNVFAPSCIAHTVLYRDDWATVEIKSIQLSEAMQCWASTEVVELKHLKDASLSFGNSYSNSFKNEENRIETSESNAIPVSNSPTFMNDEVTHKTYRQRRKRKRHSRRRMRNRNRQRERRRQNLVSGNNTQLNVDMLGDDPNGAVRGIVEFNSLNEERLQRRNNRKRRRQRRNRRKRKNQLIQGRRGNNNEERRRRRARKIARAVRELPLFDNTITREGTVRTVAVQSSTHRIPNTLSSNGNTGSVDMHGTIEQGSNILVNNLEPLFLGESCVANLADSCGWPHCNPSCPTRVDPFTGEQMNFTQLLESFGLNMTTVAKELGMDIHALNNMSDSDLLNMLTQR